MVDNIIFFEWLINRMIYKYQCDKNDLALNHIQSLVNKLKLPKKIDISDEDLNLILSKYYVDFNLDYCSDINIGYSDSQRSDLRNTIRSIVFDIVNKNIPKETLIK